VVVHDIGAKLARLAAEVGADTQDGLPCTVGIPCLPAGAGVGVHLVQHHRHHIALLEGLHVLLEDVFCMVMGAGDLLRQEHLHPPAPECVGQRAVPGPFGQGEEGGGEVDDQSNLFIGYSSTSIITKPFLL